jgi:hypothetical protein
MRAGVKQRNYESLQRDHVKADYKITKEKDFGDLEPWSR